MNYTEQLAFKQTVNIVAISSEEDSSPPLKSSIASLYGMGFVA